MDGIDDKGLAMIERLKKDNVKFVNLQFSDLLGITKSLTIPVGQVKSALASGVWFDGSSVEGFNRIHESDMYLMPDRSTYSLLPWLDSGIGRTARFICDIYRPDDEPYSSDPRHILKKVIGEAKSLGYIYNVGPEPEFFLFKKEEGDTFTHDKGGYFDLNLDKAFLIRSEMVDALEKLGIVVEASHHEVATGQHEIDFKYDHALKTADNVITFKFVLKAIANMHDLIATFMPKPVHGINGSGMHCHQSLSDLSGKNLFYDKDDPYRLSSLAKSFIAGQLKYIREICAITSPLVNSYKRLVPGYEAPVYICWAKTNRSALIRIPRFAKGREYSARAELRCPDPSANPYLALAVMLKAGLEGIRRKLVPPDPVEEDVFDFDDKKLKDHYIDVLPGSLGDALGIMASSALVKSVLGDDTFNKYLSLKKMEWDDYRRTVHAWERDRYLEVH